ncbi:MAG: porin, partial [Tannerellaceae bacterium]
MRTWLSALCLSTLSLAQPLMAAGTNEIEPTQTQNVENFDSVVAKNRDDFRLLRNIKMNRDLLNIKLDMRIDFEGAANQHTKDVAAFKANAFKLVLQGDITPNISYLVRQRLNKIGNLGKDNFLDGTDFAFVNFKLGKGWDLTVGKQPVQFG